MRNWPLQEKLLPRLPTPPLLRTAIQELLQRLSGLSFVSCNQDSAFRLRSVTAGCQSFARCLQCHRGFWRWLQSTWNYLAKRFCVNFATAWVLNIGKENVFEREALLLGKNKSCRGLRRPGARCFCATIMPKASTSRILGRLLFMHSDIQSLFCFCQNTEFSQPKRQHTMMVRQHIWQADQNRKKQTTWICSKKQANRAVKTHTEDIKSFPHRNTTVWGQSFEKT